MKHFHLAGTVIWSSLAIPGLLLWKNSIYFLVTIALYNVVVNHFVGWQNARAEEKN